MKTVLCQIAPRGRNEKPETLQEYGKLRESMIQGSWACLPEEEFIDKVTTQGYAFYGCLFNGRDLQELQNQKLCWYTQTLIGLDFDKCFIDKDWIINRLTRAMGREPWLGYHTFSDGQIEGVRSFRLLWKVDTNLNSSYEDVHSYIKYLARLVKIGPHGLADKYSMDPSRLWQGSLSGPFLYNPNVQPLETPRTLHG